MKTEPSPLRCILAAAALLLAGLLPVASADPGPATESGTAEDMEPIAPPPLRHELPWSFRRNLPGLDITVFYWNEDPRLRFVKINGEKSLEGDTPAPDLTLLEIRPDGAVFEFRGTQFLVPAY